jgi:alkylation response protein AidB-like acyl-CoA dehydrogenase
MNDHVGDLFPYPKNWVDADTVDFAGAIKRWVDGEIMSNRIAYQKAYTTLFQEKRKKHNLDIGSQRLLFPEEYGGTGFNTPDRAPALLTVVSELSRGDAGLGFMLSLEYIIASVAVMEPNFNKDVCDLLAPLFCSDDGAVASLIMPGMGSSGDRDPLFKGMSIRARLEKQGAGYLLQGEKLRPLGNGADADLFCVVCALPDGSPRIAYVRGDAAGIERSGPFKKTGLDACMNADVSFKVEIPESHVITRPQAVHELYIWQDLLLSGVSIGAAMDFFEILRSWSENRVIKGKGLLRDNPLCAAVLADVVEEIATGRVLNYNVANLIARSDGWGSTDTAGLFTAARMFGRRARESALRALNRGMELMGSAGYAKEWHVEKHWRDIKTVGSYLCGVGADVPVKMDIAGYFYGTREIGHQAVKEVAE